MNEGMEIRLLPETEMSEQDVLEREKLVWMYVKSLIRKHGLLTNAGNLTASMEQTASEHYNFLNAPTASGVTYEIHPRYMVDIVRSVPPHLVPLVKDKLLKALYAGESIPIETPDIYLLHDNFMQERSVSNGSREGRTLRRRIRNIVLVAFLGVWGLFDALDVVKTGPLDVLNSVLHGQTIDSPDEESPIALGKPELPTAVPTAVPTVVPPTPIPETPTPFPTVEPTEIPPSLSPEQFLITNDVENGYELEVLGIQRDPVYGQENMIIVIRNVDGANEQATLRLRWYSPTEEGKYNYIGGLSLPLDPIPVGTGASYGFSLRELTDDLHQYGITDPKIEVYIYVGD